MPRIYYLHLLLLALLAACNGGDSPSEIGRESANGQWEYILPGFASLGPVVEVTLSEGARGQISGTGMIYDAEHHDAVVQGTRSGTKVDLTVTTNVCTVLFSGSLNGGKTLIGTAVAQSAKRGYDCRQGNWTLTRR